jgi:V/A-type H+/Na+-transporting ATPase subunit G/H
MQATELVKNLAEVERELAERLNQARQSADDTIKKAEQERSRILAEADEQVRQETDASKARIAGENEKISRDTDACAAAQAQSLREEAEKHVDRAIEFIVSKVMP